MRDQYAGDVSDFLKFALLRALAGSDRTLGIAWYYGPGDDGRADGRHLEWRNEPAWHALDPAVHAGLSTLPERSIAALEAASIWPAASLFHREPLPYRHMRPDWAKAKRDALAAADIVFLDPDNGLGSETPKHATFSELRLLRRPGRSIVFISFPSRSATYAEQVLRLHDRLRSDADADRVITLRTNVSVPRGDGSAYLVQRPRWFTVVDPDDEIASRLDDFAIALNAVPRAKATIEHG